MLGINLPKIKSKRNDIPLYKINKIQNDININKLNIDISNNIIENICIQYKDIKSGLFIHLFNLDNIYINQKKKTFFDVDAYSYCTINNKLKFQILFNNSIANCFFKKSYSIIEMNFNIYKTKKILKANCEIDEQIKNLDDYYFPVAKSNNNLYINISNKRKYLSLIFKNFYCKNMFKCIMIAFSYKNIKKGYKIIINIFNKRYKCKLYNKIVCLNNDIPILAKFLCGKILFKLNILT